MTRVIGFGAFFLAVTGNIRIDNGRISLPRLIARVMCSGVARSAWCRLIAAPIDIRSSTPVLALQELRDRTNNRRHLPGTEHRGQRPGQRPDLFMCEPGDVYATKVGAVYCERLAQPPHVYGAEW